MKTLILYSSYDGQTQKIARAIAAHLTDCCECDVVDLRLAHDLNLQCYQRVVIGTAIRYGRFAADIDHFIAQQLEWLHSIPSAFYSVNLTARKPDKRTSSTNTYTRKFLAKTPWRPDLCAVFAGALCYPRYRWFDRVIIQMIMSVTGGETDRTKEVEYTDWQQVSTFADDLAQLTAKQVTQCL
ncbi:protoporphyrinogen oxidase [Sodalis-like endosymbiont of Proechinophthirus fluctus]|uniref:menaquinone-dependent protoporphyrinogen IX dehydrogenase n=1 Tax=Sodalis-like endosymbiont of Proechinophthirus fluctus TaxID=1462730 RepID=UPI0007A810C3|nr:menaquinone-dependent protoporphyrinogen IX dehydrogenase [Sodalis-like endosymbiont of Proechinophthirus fluctus]KYP97414.1 protoporphyrinogen oxidase [Sodalis-like endosymbiont of Proechinophthirus fluctus]